MGEYAEMILDGFVDEITGEIIDGESPGYPRRRWKGKPKRGIGDHKCPKCGKRFQTEAGVINHDRDMHTLEGKERRRQQKLNWKHS